MKQYILNVLIGLDQFITTWFGGWPDETISSYLYRLDIQGKPAGRMFRPVVDWMFSGIEDFHCRNAFLSEKDRRQFPPELRQP